MKKDLKPGWLLDGCAFACQTLIRCRGRLRGSPGWPVPRGGSGWAVGPPPASVGQVGTRGRFRGH
jgi:hypothetical protein